MTRTVSPLRLPQICRRTALPSATRQRAIASVSHVYSSSLPYLIAHLCLVVSCASNYLLNNAGTCIKNAVGCPSLSHGTYSRDSAGVCQPSKLRSFYALRYVLLLTFLGVISSCSVRHRHWLYTVNFIERRGQVYQHREWCC